MNGEPSFSKEKKSDLYFETKTNKNVKWEEINDLVMKFLDLTVSEYVPGSSADEFSFLNAERFKEMYEKENSFVIFAKSRYTNEVVGMAFCEKISSLFEKFYLSCICFEKEYREGGRVGFLMRKVLDECKKRNGEILMLDALDVSQENKPSFARKLIKNYGNKVLSVTDTFWNKIHRVKQKRIEIRVGLRYNLNI